MDSSSIKVQPAPWATKAETYWLALYLRSGVDSEAGVYAPLEASAPTIRDPVQAGKHVGGLGLIMIVRYTDTPVGMLLVPQYIVILIWSRFLR